MHQRRCVKCRGAEPGGEDYAIPLGEESFDATATILAMPLADILRIEDHQNSSDSIGEQHVNHDGPFEVEIVDAIIEFFGVGELEEITQEMLDAAGAEYAARPEVGFLVPVSRRVESTVSIHVRARDAGEAQRLALRRAKASDFKGAMTTYAHGTGDPERFGGPDEQEDN